MTVDYGDLAEIIGDLLSITLPIAVYIGLVERLVSMALDAMLDRIRRRERL